MYYKDFIKEGYFWFLLIKYIKEYDSDDGYYCWDSMMLVFFDYVICVIEYLIYKSLEIKVFRE